MGWIIFVIVLLVVLSSMRSKAKRTRAQSMRQMALLQGIRPGAATPTQGNQPYPPAPGAPPGWGMPTGQPGQPMQGRQPAAVQPNAQAQFTQSMKLLRTILSGTMPAGTAPVFQPGNSSTYRPGNAPVYSPGNPGTYRPGDAATYAPGD